MLNYKKGFELLKDYLKIENNDDKITIRPIGYEVDPYDDTIYLEFLNDDDKETIKTCLNFLNAEADSIEKIIEEARNKKNLDYYIRKFKEIGWFYDKKKSELVNDGYTLNFLFCRASTLERCEKLLIVYDSIYGEATIMSLDTTTPYLKDNELKVILDFMNFLKNIRAEKC